MNYLLRQGDSLDFLRRLRSESIDAIVSDPPYELGFMAKDWDSTGIAYRVDFWREPLRVLKPGAHLLAFGGTRTYHRMTVAIEDAGFEVRDSLDWIYGQGFPKSLNIEKATSDARFAGWGTALKPAHEPIVLARKPLAGTVAANVLAHGTGGLNVDACRIGVREDDDIHAKNPHTKGGFGHAEAQVYGASDGAPAYDPGAGRWPPNLLLTHDPRCNGACVPGCPVAMLDAQSGTLKSGEPNGKRNAASRTFAQVAGNGADLTGYGDSGGASRFFPTFEWSEFDFRYCAKASKSDRGARDLYWRKLSAGDRLDASGYIDLSAAAKDYVLVDRETWEKLPEKERARGNIHPAVKPIALMRWLVRLVTPPGGVVLDPFLGSGTTGVAALREGFRFIGIEKEEKYLKIAETRITESEAA